MRRLQATLQSIEHDQTAKRATQQALFESEARFRDGFECSTVGQTQAGPDGKPVKVNQAFADMLGLSIEELQQVAIADITHPDDVAENRERFYVSWPMSAPPTEWISVTATGMGISYSWMSALRCFATA